jgi:hypothetical protein
MAKIELLLGGATTPEREEQIEELVCDLEVSIETALNIRVKALIQWLSRVNKDNQNYLDLVATVAVGYSVQLPKISFGIYRHRGYMLPKMIMNGFHFNEMQTSEKCFISNKIIDEIGFDIENTFEFEYWGFNRIGKVVPSKSDVIYHLADRPHIYHSGKFLAAYTKRQGRSNIG